MYWDDYYIYEENYEISVYKKVVHFFRSLFDLFKSLIFALFFISLTFLSLFLVWFWGYYSHATNPHMLDFLGDYFE